MGACIGARAGCPWLAPTGALVAAPAGGVRVPGADKPNAFGAGFTRPANDALFQSGERPLAVDPSPRLCLQLHAVAGWPRAATAGLCLSERGSICGVFQDG